MEVKLTLISSGAAAGSLMVESEKFDPHIMMSAGVCIGGKGHLHSMEHTTPMTVAPEWFHLPATRRCGSPRHSSHGTSWSWTAAKSSLESSLQPISIHCIVSHVRGQKVWEYVYSFRRSTQTWWTDGQTACWSIPYAAGCSQSQTVTIPELKDARQLWLAAEIDWYRWCETSASLCIGQRWTFWT